MAGWSWLGMQVLHELGHVLGAVLTGGQVSHVLLKPWAFSRTDLVTNPHPRFVAWAGIIAGIAFPLAIWTASRKMLPGTTPCLRFFAGFCMVATGAYMIGGTIFNAGDPADLGVLGMPAWRMIATGGMALAAGLATWNGLAGKLGFGRGGKTVSRAAAMTSSAILIVLVIVELLIS
jgi:hypothetical protein